MVLLPWIHSIKMQTFDSVCCDIVENCNIVTVFSTYIWILFALIIKFWWSFHSRPCELMAVSSALQNQNVLVDSCYRPVPVPLVMLLPLLHVLPVITPGEPYCKAVLGAMHAFSAWLQIASKTVEGSPGAVALLDFQCLSGAWSGCMPLAEPPPACTHLRAPGGRDAGGNQ